MWGMVLVKTISCLAIHVHLAGAAYVSTTSGNYGSPSTWAGGSAPPNGQCHDVTIDAGHTVTITGNGQADQHTITVKPGATLDYADGQNDAFVGSTVIPAGGAFLISVPTGKSAGAGSTVQAHGTGVLRTQTDSPGATYDWSSLRFDGGGALTVDFNTSQSLAFTGTTAINGVNNRLTLTGDGTVKGISMGALEGAGTLTLGGSSLITTPVYQITRSSPGFSGTVVVTDGILELTDTPFFKDTEARIMVDGARFRHAPGGQNNSSDNAFNGLAVTLTRGGAVELTTNQAQGRNQPRKGDFIIRGAGTIRTTDTGGGAGGTVIDSASMDGKDTLTVETSTNDVELFIIDTHVLTGANTLQFTTGPADLQINNLSVFAGGTVTINHQAAGQLLLRNCLAPRVRGNVDLLRQTQFTLVTADAAGQDIADSTAFDTSGMWSQGGDTTGAINAGNAVTATLGNRVGILRSDGDDLLFPPEDAGCVEVLRFYPRTYTFRLHLANLTKTAEQIAQGMLVNPRIVAARAVNADTLEFDYVCTFRGTAYLAWDNHEFVPGETTLGADVVGISSEPTGTVISIY